MSFLVLVQLKITLILPLSRVVLFRVFLIVSDLLEDGFKCYCKHITLQCDL